MEKVLGVDIGGVVIAEIKAQGGLAHIDEDFLDVPPVLEAIEVLWYLNKQSLGYFGYSGNNIHLISKARQEVEPNCREWLRHYRFFEKTGIPLDNLHFCRERSGKKDLCIKLGVTHFIDDKLEVLSHLVGVVPNLFLFNPEEEEVSRYKPYLKDVRVMKSWDEILHFFIAG
jgi:hypothetical protein